MQPQILPDEFQFDDESEPTDENDRPVPEILPTSPEWPIFKRAAELVKQKYKMAKELKALNKELGQLQPTVLNYMAQRGLTDGVTIDEFKLYTRAQLWARVKTGQMELACAAMRATGLEHFVHDAFNVNTFSAHLRGLEEENQERIASGEIPDVSALLPPAVVASLNITTDVTLMGIQKRKKK